jgi:winged helix DNA-binding protein
MPFMSEDTLTTKELNRATLARQMLLAREKTTALKAIERLAGLQAQLARPPFIGLWSRLAKFRPEDLTRLVHDRKVVRATMMRGTLHIVSARDYLALRPTLQPMLSAAMQAVLRDRAQGLDLDALAKAARACLDERPRTFEEVRAVLRDAWPKADERAMGYAVRTHLPLVQVPTETLWGWPGAACFAVAESWMGKPVGTTSDLHTLVLRYLAAFGPATVADAETWSYLRGLKDTFEELRPKLRVFRNEGGRELFDLPKAPRPPADTPAPVRFLPDYDNLLLSHADRTRVIRDEHRPKVATANLRILATFLVDGMVGGTWKIERAKSSAALVLEPFAPLSKKTRAELAKEGMTLLRFAESDARSTEVRWA